MVFGYFFCSCCIFFFFFNDTATTEIYTLSLHDALLISPVVPAILFVRIARRAISRDRRRALGLADRKSTRLNSSHPSISYAVFCLKKKNTPPLPFLSSKKKKQRKTK